MENDGLDFARWVPVELRAAAREKVAGLNPVAPQMVIDEWAGCLAQEKIEASPLGYLQAMIRHYQEGSFRLNLADAVADIRAKQLDVGCQDIDIENYLANGVED